MARRKRSTVAIVGSHVRTRLDAPWDDQDVDIWVFNEAASIGWPKRVDGVFQMHAEPVWMNPLNRNDPKHLDWLKKKHPVPIWMLDAHNDVPSSVKYPREDITRTLLDGLYQVDNPLEFYTCTVDYALALAIHKGYERILIYGIEMASDTEYTYQRDGVFFWLGLARGRGIDVVVHAESQLFDKPLYGYEGGAYLGRSELMDRQILLESGHKEAAHDLEKADRMVEKALEQAMNESAGVPGQATEETVKRYFYSVKLQTEAVIQAAAFQGALDEIKRYLEKCEQMDAASGQHMLARQEFELTAAGAERQKVQFKSKLDVYAAEARSSWKALSASTANGAKPEKLEELGRAYGVAHQNYMRVAYDYGRMQGIVNENVTLLDQVDRMVKAAGGLVAEEALISAAGMPRVSAAEMLNG